MNKLIISLIFVFTSSCMLKVNQKDISSNEASIDGVPSGLNNKTAFTLLYTCPSCDRIEYKFGLSNAIQCESGESFQIYTGGEISLQDLADGEIKLCIRGYKKNKPQDIFYQQEYTWTKDTLPPSISFSLNENLFSGSLNESASVEIETDDGEPVPSDLLVEQCVGTEPGLCDVSDWIAATEVQSNSSQNKLTLSKLNTNKIQLAQALTSGQTYYSNVRLKDQAGNASEIVSGAGWKATTNVQFNQLCFDEPVNDVLDDVDSGVIYYVGQFQKVGLCANKLALFESSGRLVTEKQNAWDYIDGAIHKAISDGQGGWFIGGNFTVTGHSNIRNLAHINSDMTINATFQIRLGSASESTSVFDMNIDGGYLYVAGDFTEVNGDTNIINLFRVSMANYSVDTAWLQAGSIGSADTVYKIKATDSKIYVLVKDLTNSYNKNIFEFSKVSGSTSRNLFGCDDCNDSFFDFEVVGNDLYAVGKDMPYDCDMFTCNQYFNNFVKLDLATLTPTDLSSYTNDTPDAISQIQKIGDYLYYISNKQLHKINLITLVVNKNILPTYSEVQKISLHNNNKVLVEGLSKKSDSIEGRNLYRLYDLDLTNHKNLPASIIHGKVALDLNNNILNYNVNSILSKSRTRFVAVDRATHEVLPLQIHLDDEVNKIIKSGNYLVFAGDFQNAKHLTSSLQNLKGMLIYSIADDQIEAVNYGTANSFNTVDALEKYGDFVFFGGNFKFTSSNNETTTSLVYEDLFSYNLKTKKSKARSFYTNSYVKTLLVHDGKLFVGGFFSSVRSTSPTTNTTRRHLVSYDLTQDAWPLHNYNSSFTVNSAQIRHLKTVGTNIFVEGMYNSLHYVKILNPSAAAMTVDGTFSPTFSMTSSTSTFKSCDVKDGILYAYGVFDTVNGQSQNNFAMISLSNGSTVSTPAWLSPLNNGGQYNYNINTKIIFSDDRLYIPGLKKKINSSVLNGLGVFDLDTEDLVN